MVQEYTIALYKKWCSAKNSKPRLDTTRSAGHQSTGKCMHGHDLPDPLSPEIEW